MSVIVEIVKKIENNGIAYLLPCLIILPIYSTSYIDNLSIFRFFIVYNKLI